MLWPRTGVMLMHCICHRLQGQVCCLRGQIATIVASAAAAGQQPVGRRRRRHSGLAAGAPDRSPASGLVAAAAARGLAPVTTLPRHRPRCARLLRLLDYTRLRRPPPRFFFCRRRGN
ncbi:hypothetical protein MTO96_001894 [Rhipicephalus appendiculatus]